MIVGCSKDKDLGIIGIVDIIPSSAAKDTEVIITGTNFGTDITKVQVIFSDNNEAEVISVTDDKITTKVPVGAKTGVIKVIIDGKQLSGPQFEYILTPAQVETFAGIGTAGAIDGAALTEASFSSPYGITRDADGNFYVCDLSNNKIRKIGTNGFVTTFAGSGAAGSLDGIGETAEFSTPACVAIDSNGNLIVSDVGNSNIRKISPNGVVTTIAGTGVAGFADGVGTVAQFSFPIGIAVDAADNIYVADFGNHRIRKINSENVVSTLVGSVAGFTNGSVETALLDGPTGLTFDAEGNLFVTENGNNSIRKITPEGNVSLYAGNGMVGDVEGDALSAAQFNSPIGITSDNTGAIYITDTGNHKIKKISPSGQVNTFAGTGDADFQNGTPENAKFNSPINLVIDSQGNTYVTETVNHRVRKIIPEL